LARIQLQQYCADHGHWYVPHELRGTLLNLHPAFEGHEQAEPLFNEVMAALKASYFDQHKSTVEGLPKKFIPSRPKSELLWQQFEMPLISAGTFQRSETIYDLFDEADELRRSAAPFRAACAEADLSEEEGRPDKAASFTANWPTFSRMWASPTTLRALTGRCRCPYRGKSGSAVRSQKAVGPGTLISSVTSTAAGYCL